MKQYAQEARSIAGVLRETRGGVAERGLPVGAQERHAAAAIQDASGGNGGPEAGFAGSEGEAGGDGGGKEDEAGLIGKYGGRGGTRTRKGFPTRS